jgi:hypothetical protein
MTIAFTYDPIRKQVISSDPGIFVERINISREGIYAFCLNWHAKRIVINAKCSLTGELPLTHHDWTITGIGSINTRVPAYRFSSNAEINEVAALALNAMRVMPRSLHATEQPTIAAEFSADIKAFLQKISH